jgi:hypothetical protein
MNLVGPNEFVALRVRELCDYAARVGGRLFQCTECSREQFRIEAVRSTTVRTSLRTSKN